MKPGERPTGSYHLERLLMAVFYQQARDVLSRVRLDQVEAGIDVDISHWNTILANTVRPFMIRQWEMGINQSMWRISHAVAHRKGLRLQVTKAARFGRSFELLSPRVLDAIDAATFTFCRETNETATVELNQALVELRRLMKEGLPRGIAYVALGKKVRQIFADPFRALRIAQTETVRAIHLGQLMAAKDSGIVVAKRWLASSDACEEICTPLADKEVGLDEPFWINPRGNPAYRVVQHPPAHPFCMCSMTEVLGSTDDAVIIPTRVARGIAKILRLCA